VSENPVNVIKARVVEGGIGFGEGGSVGLGERGRPKAMVRRVYTHLPRGRVTEVVAASEGAKK
jgi:hypothetical protein